MNQIIKQKMNFLNCKVVLIFYCTINYVIYADVTQLFPKIMNDFQPLRIVVFIDFSVKFNQKCDRLFRILIKNIPTVSLDINNLSFIRRNRTIRKLQTVPLDQSLLYVIVQSQNTSLEKTFLNLNNVVAYSPVSARPKCLLTITNYFDKNKIEKMLRKAWSLKFLDFTVLRMSEMDTFSWNPFTNQYYQGYLNNKHYTLFPDKLIDVNKYPLKVLMWNKLSYKSVERKNNKLIQMDGSSYNYIEVISKKLNFDLNVIIEPSSSFKNSIENLFHKLGENEVNVAAVSIFLTRFQNKNVVIGYPTWVSKIVLVLPNNLTIDDYDFPPEMFITIVSFPIIILIFVTMIKLSKFKSQEWTILKIVQILIGTATRHPRNKNNERIVFLTVVLLSMLYGNIFFSNLTNTKLKRKFKEFNTYEDILESDLPIYSFYENSTNQNLPKDVDQIFSKSQIMDSVKCLEKIIETNYAICITSGVAAEFYIKYYLAPDGSQILKESHLSFPTEPLALGFEKASPYAEKFSIMIQKIFESKVAGSLKIRPKIQSNQNPTPELEVDVLVDMLEIILFVGYSVAIFVFVCELIRFPCLSYLKKKLLSKVRKKEIIY